ncbi:MAG: formate dehydrogenase subunit gamma [Gammaproteobacteria bacterium]|nr:formate dehydrogenase subunit gamma [Gammaproteobacteria bacterium]
MKFLSKMTPWIGALSLAAVLTLIDLSAIVISDGQVALAQSQPPDQSTAIAPSSPGSSVRPPASQKWGEPAAVPTNLLPQESEPTVWGRIRLGTKGNVSIPNKEAGLLVQSQGERWRQFRMNDLAVFGGWLIIGIIVVLALFYFARGRIKIDAGFSGYKILRFNTLERVTHWLTAVPFCVLALTGLNLTYGRELVLPIIGPNAFSASLIWGKYLHNFMGFAFIVGIVLMIVLWVKDNLWDKYDLGWIRTGGGLFSEGVHPPAKKFNFGQKALFWAVVLAGGLISYTGISLMFPFEMQPFKTTFAILNAVGFNFPTEVEVIQEMQLLQAWHAILALAMTAFIIAHIYIGTLGMVGAVGAMWDGDVDENWAREHHAAWVAELKGEPEPEPLSDDAGGPVAQEGQAAHE